MKRKNVFAELAPDRLLAAYASGIFPMADENGALQWFSPDPRAIIELDAFKAPRSLRAVIHRGTFEVTVNRDFERVIDACADRGQATWISPEIREAYTHLHELGFAHSVECWKDGTLAGGLYGVAFGAAFFGESMFHRTTDASKVALEFLVRRMREKDYRLLDIQFMTEHLRRLGATEIPRRQYLRRLRQAVEQPRAFDDAQSPTTVQWQTTSQ